MSAPLPCVSLTPCCALHPMTASRDPPPPEVSGTHCRKYQADGTLSIWIGVVCESGYLGCIRTCSEVPAPPPPLSYPLGTPRLPVALPPRHRSRPPKFFAPGWVSRFEQAAPLGNINSQGRARSLSLHSPVLDSAHRHHMSDPLPCHSYLWGHGRTALDLEYVCKSLGPQPAGPQSYNILMICPLDLPDLT